ncbi:hypothetical protein L7F22_069148 [Adiantum nelumboides]|nr:hypothetical protein [Adiantum nelumboides]
MEKATLDAEMTELFLQAAGKEFQEKLELLLEDKDVEQGLKTNWNEVEDAVSLLAKRQRRRDKMVVNTSNPISATSDKMVKPPVITPKFDESIMDELVKGMRDLKVKLAKLEEKGQPLGPLSRPRQQTKEGFVKKRSTYGVKIESFRDSMPENDVDKGHCIRLETGWNDPVDSMSVHAYITHCQNHEAIVEEKRRCENGDEGPSKRSTRSGGRNDATPPRAPPTEEAPSPEVTMEEFTTGKKKEPAKDGCSVMTGAENGLVTRFAREIPHLVGVHCIAHRDALAVKDALSAFPILDIVEKAAKKAYKWVNSSYKRHEEIKELANDFQLSVHELLRMHDVRWLSRGQATKRLVALMPALLHLWMREKCDLYAYFTSFKVQFFLHLLADVLHYLNNLNKKFQVEHVDVTSIGTELVTTMDLLQARFLSAEFGRGAQHITMFTQRVQNGCLVFENGMQPHEKHALHIQSVGDKDQTTHLVTWEAYIDVGRQFVRQIIISLHARFHDLGLFEAIKFLAHEIIQRMCGVSSTSEPFGYDLF